MVIASIEPESTDEDEVSGRFFNYSPSPNLKLTTFQLWGNYEVILFKIHSIQEKFWEDENLA